MPSRPFEQESIYAIALCLALHAAAGCSKPADQTPSDAGQDRPTTLGSLDGGAEGSVADSIPAGGRCITPGDAEVATIEDASVDSDGGLCGLDAGGPAYSTTQPMGLGYPTGEDILPDHVAYLTFDDGPSEWTLEFLDILRTENVRATFFVNARNLKGAPGLDGTYMDAANDTVIFRDVLKRTVDDGHVIGNHTVDHLDLATQTEANAAKELDLNEQLVSQALVRAGGQPRLLTLVRPPFGSPWSPRTPLPADPAAATMMVGRLISLRGLNILWTLDSSDSREWAQDESYTSAPGQVTIAADAPTYADKIVRIEQTVLGNPKIVSGKGAVILMHDTHDATRDALAAVIDGLRAQGYSFATLEDYALWRWGRPSAEVTPGPDLFDSCVPQSDWGCESFGGAVGTDPARDVCGRMWRAYQSAGGFATLGAPRSACVQSSTGSETQSFERATLELHPENPIPCNVVAIPAPNAP
jgi:peptidoglycan/xylan/chitin deacetylase (PgdA/CDA1 family)